MNNLDEIRKIKPFHQNESDESINIQKSKESDESTLIVANVTICLTFHNQCSGKYVNSTGKYIINCLCECHKKIKNENNDTI